MNFTLSERVAIRAQLNSFLARAQHQPRLRSWTEVYGPMILALLADTDELTGKLAIEKVESKEYEKRVAKTVDGLRGRITAYKHYTDSLVRSLKQQRETIRVLRARLEKQAEHHAAWKKEYAKARAEFDEARGQSGTAFVFVAFDVDGPHLSGKHGG